MKCLLKSIYEWLLKRALVNFIQRMLDKKNRVKIECYIIQ
jgi:hypothetical protein